MSTRVHQLAKELGLKSQDLLEKIQKWGLDVKNSTLASLDEGMVDKIKGLAASPASSPAPAAPTPAPPRPAPTASTNPASSPTPPPAQEPPAIASPPTQERPRTAPATAAPSVSRPAPASSGVQAPAETAPSSPVGAASPRPAAHSGLTAPPRSGPLSGHTSHTRTTAAGPLSRSSSPGSAPSSGGQPHPAPAASGNEPRPNPSSPPPLKRSDYLSPTGTRVGLSGRAPMPAPGGPPPLRRDTGTQDGGRRDSSAPRPSARPLPPVSSSTGSAPPTRRPEAPRAAGPEAKAQRPDQKFTYQQLLEMRRTGQLESGPASTQAPGRPGLGSPPGTRSGLTGRPGGPPPGSSPRGPATPGLRRPPAPGGPVGAGTGIAPPPVIEEEDDKKGKPGSRLGSAADRAGRRAKRDERSTARRGSGSPQPASGLTAEEEEQRGRNRGHRRHQKGHRGVLAPQRKSHAEITPPISLRTLSEAIGVKGKELIYKLMNLKGELFTINTALDDELAVELAMECGVELNIVYERTAEDELDDQFDDLGDEADFVPRPPIITILGHVDPGKTSLLDKIRKANVVATESGGITQHIGAYQVEHDGKKIAFVDTPGHEAFTAMRARGANVTDIVVLVVAADDGVMPQTREAIAHAKAAEVPVVVALNKIDLPGVDTTSNINKIYGELSQEGLIPEEYGGDVPVVKTSTLTGQGLDDLLATLDAIAELNEWKANPNRPATGTCLESSKREGRGVVATVLVQDGTLRVGDIIVCGDGFGRVRAMFDDKGKPVQEAGPSTPVEVSGLDEVPTAGERFAVLDDVSRAREIAEARRDRTRDASLIEKPTITLENLFSSITQQKLKSLNLILKADVQGSLEALVKELDKLENPEVPIRILLKAVGGISESDVLLADASAAIVVGFRVAPDDRAMALADEKKIEIRRYDINYQVTDEVKKAVEGMLIPETKEVHLGRAVVRQIFKISRIGTIAGCFVTQGSIERGSKARIIREGREIYKGSVEALKRFKDDVKEVAQNFECGIKVTNFDDVKIDDVIEAYRIEVIRRTL